MLPSAETIWILDEGPDESVAMNNHNDDRYDEWVHNLQEVSLPSAYIESDVLPLRDIPNRADPRRERSFLHAKDLQLTRNEKIVPDKGESKEHIPWVLRRVVITPRRAAPLIDTAHMPNCRDPRRFRACQRRENVVDTVIGPPNLVDNPEILVEMETCSVLTIDLTEWPISVHSYIDRVPHETNILRASLLACASDLSDQLVDIDNENVSVLLGTFMRQREDDDVVEIVEDDDVTEVSGYTSGDGTEPMLAMSDVNCVYNVDLPTKSFLGDDELPPIPVVKSEPTAVRPLPSFDERDIDIVDLCDDDEDVTLLQPKLERSSSIECIRERVLGVLEVITLDSDDDDDGGSRRNAAVSEKNCTPAEQHTDLTSGVSECARIQSSLGGERESACEVQGTTANSNSVVNSGTPKTSQSRRVLLDEVTPVHVDAEIREVQRGSDATSAKRTLRHFDGARINEVQPNVINSEVDEFNQIWESMKESYRPESSITFCAASNEARTSATAGVDVDYSDGNCDTREPELPMEVGRETRKNFDNDPCLLDNNKTDKLAPRRISIVTSEAFDAQRKLLIDVLSNSYDDAENEHSAELPRLIEETTSQQTAPADTTIEQLQRVINDMTSANCLGRSIFANSPMKENVDTCSEKRKRQEPLEDNIEEVLEQPKKKPCQIEEFFDEDESTVVDKPSEQPMLNENTPATVPNNTSEQPMLNENTPATVPNNTSEQPMLNENTLATVPNNTSEQSMLNENTPAAVPNNSSTAIALLHQGKPLQSWTAQNNAPPVLTSTMFSYYWALLNHLINYVRNFNIARSSIEYLLYNGGGLYVARVVQVANETFWRNRFNHWRHNDWDRSICMESSDLPISEDTIDISPQDDETKNQVDASYFLKYPVLKTNKSTIESDLQSMSHESQFYSVRHTLQTNSKIGQNMNQEFKSNEFDTIGSDSKIKKIPKRLSLPTPIFSEHCNSLKRSRSKSDDSYDNYMNKSISPIKITLTRDQSNQQNWIASKSQECSNISKYDNLEKTALQLKCFTEKNNLKQKTLVSNKQHKEVKTSCNITIGVTKIQSCSDKIVPELENNDYISKPVISDNFIGKQSLEDHLSPFLKSRVKRLNRPSETVDVLSNFTSKRPKISEHALDTNASINININYNHLDHRDKQERRSVELSQSFNEYSKNHLPKNLKNNVSNLNISVSYSDNYEKHDMIHIRSESNTNLQIDHDSNIAKAIHTKQKISSPERRKSGEQRRKKRKSAEMDERKKKKIAHKFAEFFGDSDSDALEFIGSSSNVDSSQKPSYNDNYIDSDDGHDSDANCETNAVRFDENYINPTPLDKSLKVSEIKPVLNTAEKCNEIPTDHLELEHLSSSIQDNRDFEESVKIKEPTTLNLKKSRELSNEAVQFEKSYANSMSPENCITRLFSEKTLDTLSKTSEDNVEIRETHTDKCISEVQLDVQSENISSNISEINLPKIMTEKDSPISITEENSSEIISKDQDGIHESYADSVTVTTKTNEFPSKCLSKVQLDVSSVNILSNISEINLPKTMTEENSLEITNKDQGLCNSNGTNCDLSNNIDTMDLQEGDFDFEVDNHSVCSYDECEYSDAAESEDLANSYRVTTQSLGDNESTNNEMPISKNQHLLVSERSEVTTEQNNNHCLDKSPTYFNECIVEVSNEVASHSTSNNDEEATAEDSNNDIVMENNDFDSDNQLIICQSPITFDNGECIAEVSNEVSDSTGNNNKEATAKDSNINCVVENDDCHSDNQLIICGSPIQNEVLSSTILSPNQKSPLTFDNGEIFDDNINKETSLLSSNDATEPTSTVSLPKRNVLEDLKNPDILKKYNLFQEEIIQEEISSETFTKSIENLELQQAFESLNKINEFLETSTPENIVEERSNRLINEQLKSSVEEFKKFNIHYIDIDNDEIIKSIDNSKPTVNSFPGTFKLRNINELLEKPQASSQTNMNSTKEKTADKVEATQKENNFSDSNCLEAISNSISSALNHLILANPVQIFGLSNNSQVCIKLASNMFSNEFSTANDFPTIFTMESPPLDDLKVLLSPVKTKKDLDEYKELLLHKLHSCLERLQKLSELNFLKFSNDLFKYNTLSKETWEFQEVIITVIQCTSRLIYCAAGENKRHIMQIMEKTLNLSKYKQGCLKEAVIVYQKLANQGLIHKHMFLFDPILTELEKRRNLIPDEHFKMNDIQMDTFLEHIRFYRSLQKLPCLEKSYLKTVASGSTTARQINSFQNFSTNGVQLTVTYLQNIQISRQVQCNQTMSIPNWVTQPNSMQIPLLPMPTNSLPQQVCSICKKPSHFILLCNCCKKVKYCSLNCQRRDCKNHSKTCKKI